MVTMLLMIVISLIVLGFAQISRSEQRQSLDRQLSTQAFFAAESGVNDARQIVMGELASGQGVPEKDQCSPTTEYPTTKANPTIDAANNVTYPCLLVTTHLKTLIANVPLADGISPSVKLPLEPATSSINTLHINWAPSSTPSTTDFNKCSTSIPSGPTASSGYFVPTSSWKCPIGVMRLEIVATDSLSGSALANSQKVMFLYPVRSSAGAVNQSYAASNGAVIRANCANVTSGCNVNLTGLNGGSKYMVKISAVYASGKVTMTATNGAGNSLEFANAQVQIDATGRAQDVLRRIQVRLPLQDSSATPDYAVESGTPICKRFQYSPYVPVENANDIVGQDHNNPMCV